MRKLIYTLSETLSNYISNHFVRNDQIRTVKNQKTDIESTQQVITRYLLATNSVTLGTHKPYVLRGPHPAVKAEIKQVPILG